MTQTATATRTPTRTATPTFTFTPTPPPTPDPPVGVGSQVWGVQFFNDEVTATMLTPILNAHTKFARLPVSWRYIEAGLTNPPTYNWSIIDQSLHDIVVSGLTAAPVVFQNPAWASSTTCGPVDLVPVSTFERFMRDLVDRYDADGVNDAPGSPRIRHWEIGNEEDFAMGQADDHGSCFGSGGAAGYAAYLRAAFRGVRAADPTAIVIFGGVAYDRFSNRPGFGVDGPFDYTFVKSVMDALYDSYRTEPGYPFFTWTNVHIYNDFRNAWDGAQPVDQELRGKIRHFKDNQLVSSGPRTYDWRTLPMAITEIGMPSAPTDLYTERSETIQAAYPGQVLARAKAEKVQYISWYQAEDRRTGPATPCPTSLSDPNLYNWLMHGLLRSQIVQTESTACGPQNPLPGYVASIPHQPKPSLQAFKTADEQIGLATIDRQLTTAETGNAQIEAYRYYQAGRGWSLVAFTDTGERLGRIGSTAITASMTVNSNLLPGWTGSVDVADYLGNVTTMNGPNGVVLNIQQWPTYIRPH